MEWLYPSGHRGCAVKEPDRDITAGDTMPNAHSQSAPLPLVQPEEQPK